jgi:hypothetical protein
MTTTRERHSASQRQRPAWLWLFYLADAGLLVASGLIHLHLWDIAYRHVKTLDQLFLLQVVLTILLALALLVSRHVLVVAASALVMAGTIVGFLLARSVGIFGFKLTFSSGIADTVLIVEIAGVIMLTITGLLMRRADSRG